METKQSPTLEYNPRRTYRFPEFPNHYDHALKAIDREKDLPEVKAGLLAAGDDKQKVVDFVNEFHYRWSTDMAYHEDVENRLRWNRYLAEGLTTISIDLYPERDVAKGSMSHAEWLKRILPLLHRAHTSGIKVMSMCSHSAWQATSPILQRENILTHKYNLPQPEPKYGWGGMIIGCTWRGETALRRLGDWIEFFVSNGINSVARYNNS